MFENILKSLPTPIILVDRELRIVTGNVAAEDLLATSVPALKGKELAQYLFPATQVIHTIEKSFETEQIVHEYDVMLSGPRIGSKRVNLHAAPLIESSGENVKQIILQIEPVGVTQRMPVGEKPIANMAAILAHEVKNPLSGIRGAAQILEKHASDSNRPLTILIRDEVDRITNLINEMEVFSNEAAVVCEPVNIHEVLQHVLKVAENGFAKGIEFKEAYDPSLPPVHANRDQLVQVFLNLVKNAAEALAGKPDPSIRLITAYSGGFRFKPQGKDTYILLPVAVSVEDNAGGIPPEIKPHLFSPFMTSKEGGRGLGLAIVSRLVAGHSGHIELEEVDDGRTRFKILLPAAKAD